MDLCLRHHAESFPLDIADAGGYLVAARPAAPDEVRGTTNQVRFGGSSPAGAGTLQVRPERPAIPVFQRKTAVCRLVYGGGSLAKNGVHTPEPGAAEMGIGGKA